MTQYFNSIFAAYSTEFVCKLTKNSKFYNFKKTKINLSIKINSTSRIKNRTRVRDIITVTAQCSHI